LLESYFYSEGQTLHLHLLLYLHLLLHLHLFTFTSCTTYISLHLLKNCIPSPLYLLHLFTPLHPLLLVHPCTPHPAPLHPLTLHPGVVMREKKEGGGTFAKYKKIKKRLSQSFGKLTLAGGPSPDSDGRRASPPTKLDKLRFNGYSAEFLDRPEPNGNIPDRYALGWERLHGSDEGCRGGDLSRWIHPLLPGISSKSRSSKTRSGKMLKIA